MDSATSGLQYKECTTGWFISEILVNFYFNSLDE